MRAYAPTHQLPCPNFEASPGSAASHPSTRRAFGPGRRSTRGVARPNQRLGAECATQPPRPTPTSGPFCDPDDSLWSMAQAVQCTVSAHPRGTDAVEPASRARLVWRVVPATVSLCGFVRVPHELVEFWVSSPGLAARASRALRRWRRSTTEPLRWNRVHGRPRSWRRSTGSPLHSARQRCAAGCAARTSPPEPHGHRHRGPLEY